MPNVGGGQPVLTPSFLLVNSLFLSPPGPAYIPVKYCETPDVYDMIFMDVQMTEMEPRPKRKILLLVLTACFVFSVIFAVTLTAAAHDHDCTGEGCPVCLQIEAANKFLKALKLAGTGLFSAVCSVFPVQIRKKHTKFTPFLFSPVALKVRFNS